VKKTKSILPWFTVLMLFGLVALCARADSTIRVHMIDARSGSPIANRPVRAWTHDTAQQRNDPGFVQELTDSNGVATFHVKEPIPSYLYIHIGMGSPWDECFPYARNGFVTQEILESGVSKESACWNLPNIEQKYHPSAGDVYIFAVRNTFIESLKALGH
jgi:hypothetical protein